MKQSPANLTTNYSIDLNDYFLNGVSNSNSSISGGGDLPDFTNSPLITSQKITDQSAESLMTFSYEFKYYEDMHPYFVRDPLNKD
jgi:hypothetical protein